MNTVVDRSRKKLCKASSEDWNKWFKIIHDKPDRINSSCRGKLKDMEMTEVPHPPYSPGLTPCDFWLFRRLKDRLSGHEFEDRTSLRWSIHQFLNHIPLEEFKKAFEDWIARLNSVVERKGDYIEHSLQLL